jgi:hypothetical protein
VLSISKCCLASKRFYFPEEQAQIIHEKTCYLPDHSIILHDAFKMPPSFVCASMRSKAKLGSRAVNSLLQFVWFRQQRSDSLLLLIKTTNFDNYLMTRDVISRMLRQSLVAPFWLDKAAHVRRISCNEVSFRFATMTSTCEI